MITIYANEYYPKDIEDASYMELENAFNDYEINFDRFLSLILTDSFFHRIIILNNEFLRNRRKYNLKKDQKYYAMNTIEEALEYKRAIRKSCISHGGMSVLFLTKRDSRLLDKIKELDLYGYSEGIVIQNNSTNCPLSQNQIIDFQSCLSPLNFSKFGDIFVFSHDVEYLYHIYRVEK